MASDHEKFTPPTSPDASIWRYMNLEKFKRTMTESALWFARPDTFDDPFEGSYSAAPVIIDEEVLRSNDEANPYKHLAGLIKSWSWARQLTLSHSYVSCWHLNADENDGMWRLYGKPQESVCIESTYKRLCDVTCSEVFIGVVTYADYRTQDVSPLNLLNLLVHKRHFFSHESELRAIWYRATEPSVSGYAHPIDLNVLIQAIRLPPGCTADLERAVIEIAEKCCPGAPVSKSTIDMEPHHHPNFVISEELRKRFEEH